MIAKSSFHILTIRKYDRISLSSAFSFLTSNDHPGVNSDAHVSSTTTTTTTGTNTNASSSSMQSNMSITTNKNLYQPIKLGLQLSKYGLNLSKLAS